MLKTILGLLWRGTPRRLRRWGVWLGNPRFAVTVGAVIVDRRGRVLLLNHVFRQGSGWGIPSGFLGRGEQPEEGLRRELREEVGLELESIEMVFARAHQQQRLVELIYRCRAPASSAAVQQAQSIEVKSAAWFELNRLPPKLPISQRRLIEEALSIEKRSGSS